MNLNDALLLFKLFKNSVFPLDQVVYAIADDLFLLLDFSQHDICFVDRDVA
jgi:hypothetical protein